MIFRVKYLPEARNDSEEIRRYLSQYYVGTAKRFFALLKGRIQLLATSPYLGQVYEERPAYRRLVVQDYLVFYKVDEETNMVSIHRILHGSRDIGRFLE